MYETFWNFHLKDTFHLDSKLSSYIMMCKLQSTQYLGVDWILSPSHLGLFTIAHGSNTRRYIPEKPSGLSNATLKQEDLQITKLPKLVQLLIYFPPRLLFEYYVFSIFIGSSPHGTSHRMGQPRSPFTNGSPAKRKKMHD